MSGFYWSREVPLSPLESDTSLKVQAQSKISDGLMREATFDESYNVREVLDDVYERVALREKLILTAKQFSEKKREERFTLALKQFQNLMADFLRLYQPVLDGLRNYREGLQKEIVSLRSTHTTISGMLEVTRGIEGLAAKTQQLDAEGQKLDAEVKEKTKTAEKIDDLFNRIKSYQTGSSMSETRDSLGDVLAGMPRDLFPETSDMGKETTTSRKSAGRS